MPQKRTYILSAVFAALLVMLVVILFQRGVIQFGGAPKPGDFATSSVERADVETIRKVLKDPRFTELTLPPPIPDVEEEIGRQNPFSQPAAE